ncbi:hypothetical protein G9C85_11735 [Halorubellus sp. JP-L1]|uniref:DUF5789 family protein n=1 Tax=Halorubellus sp. JP-L1 TaxID=2715753 RepID=UPI00140D6B33|nr:DUF5789 family protein [Halorubellus sp. JP-L1]NHN42292.1 hypothetical protein [Halorubellus sp. JP-L1]
MADDEEAEEEPAVELGTGASVEGAPIARVASRLKYPQQRSRILELEGDSEVRTPDGPQSLESLLEDVDTTYFDTRQTFVEAVRNAAGHGPVATADE